MNHDYAHWAPPADEALIDLRKLVADLQDEVTRLRAAMPCDSLREYDRRRGRTLDPVRVRATLRPHVEVR